MKFARVVFLFAGAIGLVGLLPMYFLEGWIGREQPPAITHPEYFYGFLGVTIAWHVGFLIIGRDPVRFRPMMPAAMLEKATYSLATIVLFSRGRLAREMLPLGMFDLLLGVLFLLAYIRTKPRT